MLVSHSYKFIYTKTRKTAGSSVESYFEPFCMPDGEWSQRHFRAEYVSETGIIGGRGAAARGPGACWWNHMPAELIRMHLGDHTWRSYFKFCVIRNPFEKAISAFYYKKFLDHRGDKRHDVLWTNRDPHLFEEWLECWHAPMDRDTFCIEGKFALDDVIRHETLTSDMERICRQLTIPWKPERLPAFKSGIRPQEATAQRLYTWRARQLVREVYRFELQYFGYQFPEETSSAG